MPVNFQVAPQSPVSGFSVDGAVGFGLKTRLRIDSPIFGPAFATPGASASLDAETTGAAPLPGRTLTVGISGCRDIFWLNIPIPLLGWIGVGFEPCMDMVFAGSAFVSDVEVKGGRLLTPGKGIRFDGQTARQLSIQPGCVNNIVEHVLCQARSQTWVVLPGHDLGGGVLLFTAAAAGQRQTGLAGHRPPRPGHRTAQTPRPATRTRWPQRSGCP